MQRLQTIKQFVVDEFLPDVSAADLDADHDLLENGVIDSLGLLKVIAWIEEKFEVSADEVDLAPEFFRSAAAIDSFIAGAVREKAEVE